MKCTAVGIKNGTLIEREFITEKVEGLFVEGNSQATFNNYVDFIMDNSVDKEKARNHILAFNKWITDMDEQQFIVGWKKE